MVTVAAEHNAHVGIPETSAVAASSAAALYDAAFGAEPGRYPLPPAASMQSRWWRAVALGGQGRYAAAETELTIILRQPEGAPLVSLAASTRGSHLRQLGRHAAARPLDARALLSASAELPAHRAQARCDALLGLAADALGSGQTGVARRLLGRCRPLVDEAGWRAQLRWHWVRAETALCEGAVDVAREHAAHGERLAHRCSSQRHQVKSRLVHAAALGTDGGAQLAGELIDRARTHGLLPLQWAALMLLRSLGSPAASGEQALAAVADQLARRGGSFA